MQTIRRQQETEPEKLEDLVSHILEEARMVLPGIQALLGFQLIAVFNHEFTKLSPLDQYAHVAAICLSINAICFLLTPAALHRISYPNEVTTDFAKTASKLICIGMMPLLFSIVIDAYVVIQVVSKNILISGGLAFVLFAEFIYCWIIMPQQKRRHNLEHGSHTPQC